MSKEEKEKIEHDAVHKILNGLFDGKQIEELFLEFDECKTQESTFAFQCEMLEYEMTYKQLVQNISAFLILKISIKQKSSK